MNGKINCIANEGKMAKTEWENDDSDFFFSFIQCIYNI